MQYPAAAQRAERLAGLYGTPGQGWIQEIPSGPGGPTDPPVHGAPVTRMPQSAERSPQPTPRLRCPPRLTVSTASTRPHVPARRSPLATESVAFERPPP